ncbi:MAG: diphthine synthase [Thermoplasmata archaeon]|nr:diphthine synthase [Thermoplasmata archaeon]
MLYFIGLGFYSVKDISVRGKELVEGADYVFAEFYTSRLQGSTLSEIEEFLGKQVKVLSREEVEGERILLESSAKGDTVLLTAGDPMSATTHQSLRIEAMRRGIPVRIIHSSSIFTAVPGLLGLQPYKFGRTTTLARPEKDYFPTSPYDIIFNNLDQGLHTLVLLDIRTDRDYSMTATEGLRLLSRMEGKIGKGILTREREIAVVARAGSEEPFLWYGTLKEGMETDFGPPLHSVVVPGGCHFMEKEMLEMFRSHSTKTINISLKM